MSLFNQLGNNNLTNNQSDNQNQNPQQALNQLRNDPRSFLQRAGLSIPENLNDPQQIINHLLSSGQVPQARYSQALQFLRRGR